MIDPKLPCRLTFCAVIFNAVILTAVTMVASSAMAEELEPETEPLNPVPVELSKSLALEKVKSLFENEYSDGASVGLAQKLLETGEETDGDLDLRFVFFDEARSVAAKAGDLRTALKAVELTAAEFAIDTGTWKAEVFEEMRRRKLSRDEMRQLLIEGLKAIDETLRDLDTETTARLISAVTSVRKKLGSAWLSWNIDQRDRRLSTLEKHIEQFHDAQRRLSETPGDAEATLTVAKFLCLAGGDWKRGLALLRSGGKSRLRKLLELELKDSTSFERHSRLGDAWWKLSEDESPFFRDAMRLRGYEWHLRSREGLRGVAEVEIERLLHRAPRRHLTDMKEFDADIGYDGVLRRDEIVVDELESMRGLYPHAKAKGECRLKYNLDKQFKRFETCVALRDTATNPSGPFYFEVVGDGRRLWLSRAIQRRRESQRCSVNVATVKVLELRIHCKGSARQGHTVWLDPVVRK